MYCTTEDVRNETGIGADDINDDKLYRILQRSIVTLNGMINVREWDERVLRISTEKTNKVDGSNTTFYTLKYPIGDANNDGEITTSDVKAYTLNASGTRTTYTTSSIDDDELGKITLASAPSDTEVLYLNYYHAPLDEETPHELIKQACIELTAAKTYLYIPEGSIKSYRLGNFSIVKNKSDHIRYMEHFYSTIRMIIAKDLRDFIGKNEPIPSMQVGKARWED